MATVTQTPKQRKSRKAPEAVHGSARWVGGAPTAARLDDGDAILQITAAGKEPSFYHVETVRDGGAVRGWRLVKIDGLEHTATYDVEITPHGLRCDCPDAVYCDRPGGCKHAVGLAAALKAAGLAEGGVSCAR
jgi:hypothetical protein